MANNRIPWSLGGQGGEITRESLAGDIFSRARSDRLSVAFVGRLNDNTDLQASLRDSPLSESDNPALIACAWRRWGDALPAHLSGEFALSIIDSTHHRLLLARDPVGCKPLYYWHDDRMLVFATSVALLRQLLPVSPAVDPDWIARYLVRVPPSYDRTAYRDIVKLPPGHALSVDRHGQVRIWSYFQFRDDPPPARRRDPGWVDAYRACLEEAIRCRIPDTNPLGTENSGGLDSATVTAYLARFMGEPGDRLHSFGFALAELEPGYILETSQYLRITHNYLVTCWSDLDDALLDRALSVLGYPEEHGNATSHEVFYRECKLRGIRTLFSGFGGDEVVTNPAQHLRRELLDDGNWRGLWGILPGHPLLKGPRLLKALMTRNRSSALHPVMLAAFRQHQPHFILRDTAMARFDLLCGIRDSLGYSAPYRRINDFILENRLSPQMATRLENCTLMAAYHGVEYRWPLLDARLIQQYLSTPSIEKGGPGGMGRYLHRRAVAGVVPPRVAWKFDKSMGMVAVHHDPLQLLAGVAREARRQEAHLHPALDELVDREKFREQIRRVLKGEVDEALRIQFPRNAQRLRWLNHWLHDGPPD